MKIMMVCLGNICRSPIAEGIMKNLVEKKGLDWKISSSGTSGYHNGELPHTDSIQIMKIHGIDITDQRSSELSLRDIENNDLILTMDTSNYVNTLTKCRTEEQREKVKLLLNYSYPNENRAVPDPYYEGGFDKVYDMIYSACEKVIEHHS